MILICSIITSGLYLYGVQKLKTYYETRAPVNVNKYLITLYNGYQILANRYIAENLFKELNGNVWGIGIPDTPKIRNLVFLHHLTKYVDLIDTLLIILRKKNNQLSFLHVYHHSTVLIIWAWVVSTWPKEGTAAYVYGAWINSWIHVGMYAYYLCTTLNLQVPIFLKKSVTFCQIAQFVTCIIHAIAALLIDETKYYYNLVQFTYHISLFQLFLPLLLQKKVKNQ